MKYEISESDLKLIQGLLDVALRAGGLQNKPAVDRLVYVFANPIQEEKKEKNVNSKTPPAL